MKHKITLFWFRRDLRLDDNAGLYHALKKHENVLPIFIFDKTILEKLPKKDKRVDFIHSTLVEIKKQLEEKGSSLLLKYGEPLEIYEQLVTDYEVEAVYTNHDYEPYAKKRDTEITEFLKEKAIPFYSFKDQVIFEKSEVIKEDGTPYSVYTPYSRKWKEKLSDFYVKPYPTTNYFSNLLVCKPLPTIHLETMGFEQTNPKIPDKAIDKKVIKNYQDTRDIPSVKGTSHLSVHLRFGTISIRNLVKEALQLNEKWLNELIWRDFYHMILWHHPKVDNAFKLNYDFIQWRNNETEFEAWCEGNTGYPIVDAGMRELNETGYMHNRVRMVVASFLVKHLLIDWRWGEAYFAEKLLDFDLAANNGGWQWAAGSGCDAAPYFRVFNPYLQTKKFDPDLKYIKKWVPEFQDPFVYPKPIVEHDFARKRVLEVYKTALAH